MLTKKIFDKEINVFPGLSRQYTALASKKCTTYLFPYFVLLTISEGKLSCRFFCKASLAALKHL